MKKILFSLLLLLSTNALATNGCSGIVCHSLSASFGIIASTGPSTNSYSPAPLSPSFQMNTPAQLVWKDLTSKYNTEIDDALLRATVQINHLKASALDFKNNYEKINQQVVEKLNQDISSLESSLEINDSGTENKHYVSNISEELSYQIQYEKNNTNSLTIQRVLRFTEDFNSEQLAKRVADEATKSRLQPNLANDFIGQVNKAVDERSSLSEHTQMISADEAKKPLKDFAIKSLADGDELLSRAEPAFANEVYKTGLMIADVALGFIPVTAVIKDTYGLISGTNLITGEKLSRNERILCAAGVLTIGVTTEIGASGSLLLRAYKYVKKSDRVVEALEGGKKIINSAIKLFKKSPTMDGVKDLVDVVKAADNNFDDLAGFVSGKLISYGPINPGPLHQIVEGTGKVADTFRSSSYFENVLEGPLKLYRTYSDEGKMLSKYWSRIKPSGPTQAMIDSALDPSWGNKATKWIEITIPQNEKIYEGIVGEIGLQSINAPDKLGKLLGGGSQVYVDNIIPSNWISGGGGF
jgi:hypothetical protein